jgi:hypothetical protein
LAELSFLFHVRYSLLLIDLDPASYTGNHNYNPTGYLAVQFADETLHPSHIPVEYEKQQPAMDGRLQIGCVARVGFEPTSKGL